MEDFKNLPKMQAFKVGGKVSKKFTAAMEKEFPKGATITPKQDEAEDKKMVKKAVGQHESALHEGEPKTTLKLKCGGRTKKEVGTVNKYCGGKSVKKMNSGGISEAIKSVGKRLYENVMGTPEQNAAAQARLDKYEASKKPAPMPQIKGKPTGDEAAFNAKKVENPNDVGAGLTAKKRGGRCK